MPPANDDIRLAQIGQIAQPVKDLDRAIIFYRDVLGMKFLFRVPNLAFFDCAGVHLMLDVPAEPHGSTLYFKVDELERTYETLMSRGVAFEEKPHMIAKMPDHELWMAFFRDPDRNLLALMSEVRH